MEVQMLVGLVLEIDKVMAIFDLRSKIEKYKNQREVDC